MSTNPIQIPNAFEISTAKGTRFIYLKMLVFIKAENKATLIFLNDSECIKTSHYLKWYLKYTLEPDFFRCHNSYIVNCRFIKTFCSKGIILRGFNHIIPLSRKKRHSFKENLMMLQV